MTNWLNLFAVARNKPRSDEGTLSMKNATQLGHPVSAGTAVYSVPQEEGADVAPLSSTRPWQTSCHESQCPLRPSAACPEGYGAGPTDVERRLKMLAGRLPRAVTD